MSKTANINTLYFACKVTVYTKDGPMICPHETEESAQKEMDYFKGGKKNAIMEDWTDEDQAWWNERKLDAVAIFGTDYLNDDKMIGMCKLFRPSKD